MPSASRCLSTVPITPLPAGASKPSTGDSSSLRSCAAATMAAAKGCSLPRSTLAASFKTCASSKPGRATTATTFGLPSVSVPVLSTTSVSTFSMRSSASAFLISTPACAPRPTPTMIDIGVASPSAQGQAMISTLTAATSPKAKRGSGPNVAQEAKAMSAAAITVGTNQPATWSARRWIGARLRCACATICTICASSVSRPTLSARMTKLPDLVERAADDAGVGFLGHRHGFAGHHRFIERRAAFQHHAVDRHLVAGPHAQFVADRRPRRARSPRRCRRP